jgi:hypothetical protein
MSGGVDEAILPPGGLLELSVEAGLNRSLWLPLAASTQPFEWNLK